MIVGIDSNVVILAGLVPKTAEDSAEQQALARRAKILLHDLRNHLVVLPMIAVSEVLVKVPASKHGATIDKLKQLFVCSDFSEEAASIAASLWGQHKNLPADQKYDERIVMLADAKIVASAKATGATMFYSHNRDCRTLAGLIMTAKDLPSGSEELFIDQMLSEGLEDRPKGTVKPKRRRSKKSGY